MKIFVAFSESDVECFNALRKANDVVLGYGDIGVGMIQDVADVDLSLAAHMETLRALFKQESQQAGIDITGYANNFFECAIRPILRYVKSIEALVREHQVEAVVCSRKLVSFNGRPNYYLAEHESQGSLLYDRQAALQPTLIDVVQRLRIPIEFLSSGVSWQGFRNVIRDAAVFAIRATKGIRQVKTDSNNAQQLPVLTYFVIRNRVQLEFVLPFIRTSDQAVILYCASTFMGGRIYEQAKSLSRDINNVTVAELQTTNRRTVLARYIKTFFQYFKTGKRFYQIDGLNIDITQAIREVLIMSAETMLYQKQLESTIAANIDVELVAFSCEQKSPHGYFDAVVAKDKGYRCIQLMNCDQECNDLPYPVYGDVFAVDTLKRLRLFESHWSSGKEKLLYDGCIKMLGNGLALTNQEFIYKYCYFAHVTELEHNRKVISQLESAAGDGDFKYAVKLHPRDNGSWIDSNKLLNGVVIHHGEATNGELFQQFDVAISNPSAIVMDLLCCAKKFIFIDILTIYKNIEYTYCDDTYPGLVKDWQALDILLNDSRVLEHEVVALNQRVFGEDAMEPSMVRLIGSAQALY